MDSDFSLEPKKFTQEDISTTFNFFVETLSYYQYK